MIEEAVIDEKIWKAWVEKGRREDKETHRRLAWVVGFLLLVGFSAAIFYQ